MIQPVTCYKIDTKYVLLLLQIDLSVVLMTRGYRWKQIPCLVLSVTEVGGDLRIMTNIVQKKLYPILVLILLKTKLRDISQVLLSHKNATLKI